MVVVVVTVVGMIKVLVCVGVVVNMTVELLVINTWAEVVSNFVKVLSNMVLEALAVSMGVEVLADVNANVSVAVIATFELPMSIL